MIDGIGGTLIPSSATECGVVVEEDGLTVTNEIMRIGKEIAVRWGIRIYPGGKMRCVGYERDFTSEIIQMMGINMENPVNDSLVHGKIASRDSGRLDQMTCNMADAPKNPAK